MTKIFYLVLYGNREILSRSHVVWNGVLVPCEVLDFTLDSGNENEKKMKQLLRCN